MSSGSNSATRSEMSSGSSPPRASTSSQERMSTALAWPAAGSIAITQRMLSTWFAAANTRADSGGPGNDRRAGAAVGKDMAMVFDRVRDIGRHRDRPGADDREIGDDPFRPVLGDQSDAIAPSDAERAQPARQSADIARGRRPAQRLVAAAGAWPTETAGRRAGRPARRTSPAGCGSCRSPFFPQPCRDLYGFRGRGGIAAAALHRAAWRLRGRAPYGNGTIEGHGHASRGGGGGDCGSRREGGARRVAAMGPVRSLSRSATARN